MEPVKTRYAKNGDISVAYQVFGEGDLFEYIDNDWGSGESLPMFAPTMQGDAAFKQWWGKFERLGGSPGAVKALMRMNSQIDITDILPAVKVPTLVIHRTDDVTVDCKGGRLLAERIPNAKFVELPGFDHLPMVGENSDQIVDEIAKFITGEYLVAGSGLTFQDRGKYTLKGIPGKWRLFFVESPECQGCEHL